MCGFDSNSQRAFLLISKSTYLSEVCILISIMTLSINDSQSPIVLISTPSLSGTNLLRYGNPTPNFEYAGIMQAEH